MKRHNRKAIKRYLRLIGGEDSLQLIGGAESTGIKVYQNTYDWRAMQNRLVELEFTDPKSFLRTQLLPAILAAVAFIPGLQGLAIGGQVILAASIASGTLALANTIQEGGDPLEIGIDVLNIASRAAGIPGLPKGSVKVGEILGQIKGVLSALDTARSRYGDIEKRVSDLYVENEDGTTRGPKPGSEAWYIAVKRLLAESDIRNGYAYSSDDVLRDPDGAPVDLCLKYPYFPNESGWNEVPAGSFITLLAELKARLSYADFPKVVNPKPKFPIITAHLNKYYVDTFKSYSLKKEILQVYQDYLKTLSSVEYDEAILVEDIKFAVQNQGIIIGMPTRIANAETTTSNAANMAAVNIPLTPAQIAAREAANKRQNEALAADEAKNLATLKKLASIPMPKEQQDALLALQKDPTNKDLIDKYNALQTYYINPEYAPPPKSEKYVPPVDPVDPNALQIETLDDTLVETPMGGSRGKRGGSNISKEHQDALLDLQNDPNNKDFIAKYNALQSYYASPKSEKYVSQEDPNAWQFETPADTMGGRRGKRGGLGYGNRRIEPLPKQFVDPKFKQLWVFTARDGTFPENAMHFAPPERGEYARVIESFGWLEEKRDTADKSTFIIPVSHQSNAKPARRGINKTKHVSLCDGGEKTSTYSYLYGGYFSGPVNQFGDFNPCGILNKIPCLTQWNVYYADNPDSIGEINSYTIKTGTISHNKSQYATDLEDKAGAYTVGNIGASVSFWKPPSNNLPQAIAANSLLAYFNCIQTGSFPFAIDIILDYLPSSEQIANSTAVVKAAIPLWEAENQVRIATQLATLAYENDSLMSKILTFDEQAILSRWKTGPQFDELMRTRDSEQTTVAQTSIDAKANLDAKIKFRDDLLEKYNSAVLQFRNGWAKFYNKLFFAYRESGGKVDDPNYYIIGDLLTNSKSYKQFDITTTDKVVLNNPYDTFVKKANALEVPAFDKIDDISVPAVKTLIDDYFKIITTSFKLTVPVYEYGIDGDKFDNLFASTWADWYKTLIPNLYTENDPTAVSDTLKFMSSFIPSDSTIFTPYVLQSAQKAFEYYKKLIKATPTKFDSDGNPTNAIYPPALFYTQGRGTIKTIVSSMSTASATAWIVYYGRYINPNVKFYMGDSDSLTSREFPEISDLIPRVLYKDIVDKVATLAEIQEHIPQIKKAMEEAAKLGVVDTVLTGGFATRKHHGTPAYMLTRYRMRNRL